MKKVKTTGLFKIAVEYKKSQCRNKTGVCVTYIIWTTISRGFNGSVNISESCGVRSQFEPLYIII